MGRVAYYHFFTLGGGTASTPLESLDEALVSRKKGGFLWAACVNPERSELDAIAKAFSIHPLSVADCFDEDQIPKVDVFPEYSGILFNDIFLSGDTGEKSRDGTGGRSSDGVGRVSIAEINLFFGKDFVVSVFREETARRLAPEAIVDGILATRAHGIHGPARIVHAILDRVIDLSFPAIDSIGDAIADLEDACLSGDGEAEPARTHAIRQGLSVMRKSLFHERELLARLARKDFPAVPEESVIFFSDLYDHVSKFLGSVESDREAITNLAQLSLALSGDRFARAAARTNRSMTRLTFITTIFMPLTLLAGIGGMSEWTMMTGQEHWKVSYAILIGSFTLIGIVNFLILKRMNRKG